MEYKLQDSTIDLLKNLNSDDHDYLSTKLNINIIKEIKLRKINNFGLVLNSDFEPDIKKVIQYLFKMKINCYIVYFNKHHEVCYYKLDKLQFFREYYTYTNQPFVEEQYKSSNVYLDVLLCPLLNFNNQKEFIDTSFNLINKILNKSHFKEFWGYAFNFQKYLDLGSNCSNFIADIVITDEKVYH